MVRMVRMRRISVGSMKRTGISAGGGLGRLSGLGRFRG